MTSPEYEHSENKESLGDWKAAVESIAAFATASGGKIHFGIRPTGEHIGVQLGKNTLEVLANDIKKNTQPPQYPSIRVEGPEEKAIVLVHIEESPIKPVWAFGRPFKRVGRTNQRLSPEETRRLTEQTTGRTWDALPCTDFNVNDIDRSAIRDFLQRTGQNASTTTENVLTNLGFLTLNGLQNGAALLFARNPQRFFPQAQVKCARFAGTNSVRFLDQQTFNGNIFTQIDDALAFVARNTQQAIRITGRAERETIPEYPEEATREAVINAVCHRDYAMTGTVQVRIYDDRLEIWNPGLLPPELTFESLFEEHPSRPRSPKLAEALYKARVVEHWGTGTLRIIDACREVAMPRPEFASEMGSFFVRFQMPTPESTSRRLAERQQQALAYMQEHGRITTTEYQSLFAISERQARRDLNILITMGSVVRKLSGPNTYYALTRII